MSSYFFHTYPDSLKKYYSGRIFLNVYILVLPVSARVYLTQPRTWTRQWIHVYEETLLFKPSLISQFTVGTNILIIPFHPSSTVFRTAYIRYTIIPGLTSSLYTAREPGGLYRLSESFSSNTNQLQSTKQLL